MNVENFGRVAISLIAIFMYGAYVAALILIPIPTDVRDVVNSAGGVLAGGFGLAIGYWIGSSSGSASKDATIKSMTKP
jgi:hypothetical protein